MEIASKRLEGFTSQEFDSGSSYSTSVAEDSSILLIVSEEGKIEFKSESYCNLFDKDDKIELLEEIESDPDLSLILKGMQYNKTEKLSLEILCYFLNNTEVRDFHIKINRLTILGQNFYLLIFEENKIFKVFENKINTLQHALEKGDIPVLIADENYKTTYVTKNFENILRRDIENLYHQELKDILKEYIEYEDEADLLVSLNTKSKWSKVIEMVDEKRNHFYYDLYLTSVYDANLNQWNYILSAYNITDLVLKNKALEKEEERLRTIINNISDALFVLKKKDNAIHFEIGNENFFDLFIKDRENFNEKKFNKELGKSLWNTINDSLSLIEKEKLENHSQKYFDDTFEKYFQINITYVEYPHEGQRMYIITLSDTTEKEKYQKQLQAALTKEKELSSLKTLILHNMSHELRTPANAMMGYTDIIKDSIEEEDYDTIHEISSSLKEILYKLINLFNNIIELSSLESGNYELDLVHINCNQILRSVYNKHFREAEGKKLKFELELLEENLLLGTDWIKFEKMIAELTKNAIKFTEKGKVKIIASRNNKNEAEIRIVDTGTGIEESKVNKVLQPFEQEEEFYTRSYEGNGLGLTIADRIARILGGSLQINSKKNEGTEMLLRFPIMKDNELSEIGNK